ncbi:hypothetical protein [Paracoccus benzoatiresistens]|uniref:Uncharacterized protein n=1 Tax=Paracoccus benzoatiresistens TaxID=2997341 RepID=A0ABT4J770_9RHOB|nr:hypothetical protein [Paracoccus sp. EF6]MCZ0962974.1 hypothetical protein [Paracoccus sp. EF6]
MPRPMRVCVVHSIALLEIAKSISANVLKKEDTFTSDTVKETCDTILLQTRHSRQQGIGFLINGCSACGGGE